MAAIFTRPSRVGALDADAINDLLSAIETAIAGLSEYADDTAAKAGGLTAGKLYRTSAGVVMVVLA